MTVSLFIKVSSFSQPKKSKNRLMMMIFFILVFSLRRGFIAIGCVLKIARSHRIQSESRFEIPGVQEEVELMMFDGFTRFAAAAVAWFLERKRAA
jgi:hypothetical protein